MYRYCGASRRVNSSIISIQFKSIYAVNALSNAMVYIGVGRDGVYRCKRT